MLVAACMCLLWWQTASAAPNVLVTVKPVHALVAGVMAGVGTPYLLLRGNSSPHSYAMRPSDARALQSADVVVWVGPGLETFFVRPLRALGHKARVVELMTAPGIELLPARHGGVWEEHRHDDGEDPHHDADDDHGHDMIDAHIWLSPGNARAIVAAVAAALIEADGEHADRYRRNAADVTARIDALTADIDSVLAPVKPRPYIVFHDAYQYFEHSFATNAIGAITVSPDRAPGARRIAAVRDKIKTLGAVCVFAEPQFEPDIITTLIEGTGARTGTLDPIGSALDAGPAAYFAMMRNIARSLAGCLTPP